MQSLHGFPARFGVDSSHSNLMLYPVLHRSIRGPVAEPMAPDSDPTSPRREASLLYLPVIQWVTGFFYAELARRVTFGVTAGPISDSRRFGQPQGLTSASCG